MKALMAFAITLFFASPSYAAISATQNTIDLNFNGVQAVYPADLDQDGDIDFVGAASTDNDIVWWENDGAENFTKWTIDANFNGACAVYAADMDQDGDIDVLAAANVDDDVSWWENNGNPRQNNWANQYDIDPDFDGASSVYAVDMDQDGDLDILSAAVDGDDVSWWENNGNARRNNWTEYTVDADFDGANDAYPVDMDKDGDIDILASAQNANTVAWWENNSNPRQNNWANQYNIDAAFNGANSVYAVDMDKDGDPDVVSTASVDNVVAWWENDGTPRQNNWANQYNIDAAFNGAVSVFVADLDFDGDLDVIGAANVDNDVCWWQNDGNPKQNGWTENIINNNFNGANFSSGVDIDHDGDTDVIAVSANANDVVFHANDANRTSGNIGFNAEHKITDFYSGADTACAVDIDRDGDIDIAATSNLADDVAWWENNGAWTQHTVDASFDGASMLVSADIDTDGDIDIAAVATNADDLAWYENGGSESFTKQVINGAINGADSLFLADLDTDGDRDIIATAGIAGELAWFENDGSENFTKHTVSAAFNGATDASCVDLDADGDMDIVAAADIDDDVVWWQNDGLENFTKLTIDSSLDGAAAVTTCDLDRDGDTDVVACGYGGGVITWYANDGTPADGGWTKYVVDGDVNGPTGICALDLDQDGDIDIIGSVGLGDDIAWWENDSTPLNGGWTLHTVDAAFDGASSVFCIDLNRDGEIDIVGAASNGNDVSWWDNGGSAAVAAPPQDDDATPFLSVDWTVLPSETEEAETTTSETQTGFPGPGEEGAKTESETQDIDVRCFIATAAFGTPQAEDVKRLRRLRDTYLNKSAAGRAAVRFYYKMSPPIAKAVEKNGLLKKITRFFVKLILKTTPV